MKQTNMVKAAAGAAFIAAVLVAGCNNFFHDLIPPDGNRIVSFELPGQIGAAQIADNAITVTVAPGMERHALVPRIQVSAKASLLPLTLDYVLAAFPQADILREAAAIYQTNDLAAYVTGLIKRSPGFNVPELNRPIDFSGQVTFLVISGQGTIRQYAVHTSIDSGEAKLLGFGFSKYHNPELVSDGFSQINESAKTLTINAVYPAEMPSLSYALIPTFEILGEKLEIDGMEIISGEDPIQFQQSLGLQTKTITITRGGLALDYTLHLSFSEDPDSIRSITDFRFVKTDNAGLALNAVAAIVNNNTTGTISVQVLYNGAMPESLKPRVVSPGTVSVGGLTQISGVNAHDFSSPLEYLVVSRNGLYRRTYTVRVEFVSMADAAPKMLSFGFSRVHNGLLAADADTEISEGSGHILAEVRYIGSAPPESLIPQFSAQGLVSVAGSVQISGMSAQSFTRQIKYTVNSAVDPALHKDYWVQVRFVRDTSSDAVITAFGFYPDDNPGLADAIAGRIDQGAGTIELYAPVGSGVSSRLMVPRFSAVGQVSVAGAAQSSGVSGQVFSVPVSYTVTSADSTAQKTYAVRVQELSGHIYVKADAAGENNGTSWNDAFTSLHDACTAAKQFPADTPREIWIARGTYRPSESGDRDASFVMVQNTAYIGGFAGWETAKSQRNPAANPVVISGDLGGGAYARNLFANEYTAPDTPVYLRDDVSFENLRFENANADFFSGGGTTKGSNGGAIQAMFAASAHAALKVNACDFTTMSSVFNGAALAVFSGNLDVSGSRFTDCGSQSMYAVYSTGGNAAISGCTFEAADRASAGSVYVLSGEVGSVCTISGSTFEKTNQLYSYYHQGSITVADVTTRQTTSAGWGGALYLSGASISVTRADIDGAQAFGNGGGIYAITLGDGGIVIADTHIKNATVTNGGGGGMYLDTTGTITVSGCTIDSVEFAGNPGQILYASGSPGTNGGLCAYGGSIAISDTEVRNAKPAVNGSGMILSAPSGTIDVSGCIIDGVDAPGASADTGGISCYAPGGTTTITDTEIRNVTATGTSNTAGMILSASGGTIDVSGCVIDGVAAAAGGSLSDDAVGIFCYTPGGTTTITGTEIRNIRGDQISRTGIWVESVSTDISGCVIEDIAGEGIVGYGWDAGTLTVTDTEIRNVKRGMHLSAGQIDVSGCVLDGAETVGVGGGIYAETYGSGGNISVTGTEIKNVKSSNNGTTGGGGGMYLFGGAGSAIVVSGCTIDGAQAVRVSGTGGYGGGILADAGGSIVISDTEIRNATAVYGGGMYLRGATGSAISVSGCTIDGAQATGGSTSSHGGGIAATASGSGSIVITDTEIRNATSVLAGGGIYLGSETGAVEVSGCTINGAGAGWSGGGIYAEVSGKLIIKDTEIKNAYASSVTGIVTSPVSYGGGMALFSNSSSWGIEVSGCVIDGAHATQGGGIYGLQSYTGIDGGGIYIHDTEIKNVYAYYGAGIALSGRGGYLALVRCTITSAISSADGGGVYHFSQTAPYSGLHITSSTFNVCSAISSGGAVYSNVPNTTSEVFSTSFTGCTAGNGSALGYFTGSNNRWEFWNPENIWNGTAIASAANLSLLAASGNAIRTAGGATAVYKP